METVDRLDLLGIICLVLISLWFRLLRRPGVFSVASAATIAMFLGGAELGETAAVPTAAGLVAYWFGLLFVRAMLTRSVSLAMLTAAVDGGEADVRTRIASRLDEARAYRLASFDGTRYALTRLGRLVARAVCAFA